MNIFFLHVDPRIAAEYHCDKHVVKMILETAQLLYTACWILDPDNIPPNAYKKTHANHPCAIWVRESLSNYKWLVEMGLWLCNEYRFRYGEHKTHKTEPHLLWLQSNPPRGLTEKGITEIRLAMPVEYKLPNPIQSYRKYYIIAKKSLLTYSRREPPPFL